MTWHAQALKDMRKLDGQDAKRIRSTVEGLQRGDENLRSQTHTLKPPLQGWRSTKASRGHRIIHTDLDNGDLHIGYVGLHEYGDAERRLGGAGQHTAMQRQSAEDYRMNHRPGGPGADGEDDGTAAPAHRVDKVFPDFYEKPHLYDHHGGGGLFGGPHVFHDTVRTLRRARGNPEAPITMYRSLPPEHAHRGFGTGDWVSVHHDYARGHGLHETDEKQDWPVIKATVPAKHLWNNGDMVDEFGYHGPHVEGEIAFPGGSEAAKRLHKQSSLQMVRPSQVWDHIRTDVHPHRLDTIRDSVAEHGWQPDWNVADGPIKVSLDPPVISNGSHRLHVLRELGRDDLIPMQVTAALPRKLYKGVSARALGEIQASGGLQPSEMGESGPGVYLTNDHEYAKRYAGMGYGGGAVLHVEHSVQNPLVRNLDDKDDPGEKKYRDIQQMTPGGSINTGGALGRALHEAGHDAVETTWRGRHEIAVHDPAKLRITHIEHVDGEGNPRTAATNEFATNNAFAASSDEDIAAHNADKWAPNIRDHVTDDGKRYRLVHQHPNYTSGTVTAHVPHGKGYRGVGYLSYTSRPDLDDDSVSEIYKVHVDPKHQRRGLASAMLGLARESRPGLRHSPALTDEGRAWSEKVGRFTPDKRVFTHTDGMDHRLFDEHEHLRPEVRAYVLQSITVWWMFHYRDWAKWARIYFAGSEASEWTSDTMEGNNDFDVLIGVDYDGFRKANPMFAELTNQQITDRMNDQFRQHFNSDHVWLAIQLGSSTWPPNSNSISNGQSSDMLKDSARRRSLGKQELLPLRSVEPSNWLGSPETQPGPRGNDESRPARSALPAENHYLSQRTRIEEESEQHGASRVVVPTHGITTSGAGTDSRRSSMTHASQPKAEDVRSAEAQTNSTSTTTIGAAQAKPPAASASGVSSARDTTGRLAGSAMNTSTPLWTISQDAPSPASLPEGYIWTGPWSRTTFCNPDSHDITRIKPYAAYDVGADHWVVKPPHLPHWSLSELPEPVQKVLRSADSYARSVLKLPEPERTQQGAALFEAWHSDRSRAFSDRGEGWYDIANLREKWMDQAGLWAELVNCAHRAKQGLDAAPADWTNTPPGYTAAKAPRDWGTFWHGTPSGDLRGGSYGLHVGTQEAARQALHARIGFRADGKDWDGSQEYGKTLLAGKQNLLAREGGHYLLSGHNMRAPEHDHYAHERDEVPTFGGEARGREPMAMHHKPDLFPVRITSEMSNTPETAHPDFKANGYMKAQITKGNAKCGYFYTNEGEDSGSISAVVPNGDHVERINHRTAAVEDHLPPGYDMRVREVEKTERWGLPATHINIHHEGRPLPVASLSVHQRTHPDTGSLVGHPNIGVDPAHQRKGLATAMYAEMHRRWPGLPIEHSEHRSDDARALDPALKERFGPDLHHGHLSTERTHRVTAAVDIDRYFAGGVDAVHQVPGLFSGSRGIALDPQTWSKMPVEHVDPSGMYATQKRVFKKHIERHRKGGDPEGGDLPWVVNHEGKNWVVDGHHRIVNAQDQGEQTIPVRMMRPRFDAHEAKQVTAMGQAGPDYDNLSFVNMTGFEYGAHPSLHHHEMLFAKHPDHGYLGHIQYERHPDKIEIHNMTVHPEYQRRGVASQLMTELEHRNPDAVIDHGSRTEPGGEWARHHYGDPGTPIGDGGWGLKYKAPPTRNGHPVEARLAGGRPSNWNINPKTHDAQGEIEFARKHRNTADRGEADPEYEDALQASREDAHHEYDQAQLAMWLAQRPNPPHEAKLPKTQKCEYCGEQASKRLLWAEGMGYIPVCDEHEDKGRHQIEVTNKDEVVSAQKIAQASRLDQLHGKGELHHLFPVDEDGPAMSTSVPWPAAGRRREVRDYDPEIVKHAVQNPHLYPSEDVDPRELHATQPSLVREAVKHYQTDEYRTKGRTYADQHNPGNARPMIYRREDGHNLILTGHHRAAAALLKGEPLEAVVLHGGFGPARGGVR